MKPGDFALGLLKETRGTEKTIAILRHSERDSFKGIPHKLRGGVEITREGISMARGFGESLGRVCPGKHLLLGHTIANRCRMTAESIREGFSPAASARVLGCEPEIRHPVINLDNFIALKNELGWQELLRKWLGQEIPEGTFLNSHRYSEEVLANLLTFPGIGEKELLVMIAHDITLLPIISTVFGITVNDIGFLNGIVLTADTGTAEIRFSDADFSLRTKVSLRPDKRMWDGAGVL